MIPKFRTSLILATIALLLSVGSVPHVAMAQNGGAPSKTLEDAGLSPGDVDALIVTIEDADARAHLVGQLKALKVGAETATPSAEQRQSRFGGRIVETLSDRIDRISEKLVSGATVILDAPRLLGWAERQVLVPENRRIWAEMLWKVLAVLAAGLIAEWAVRQLLARIRSGVEGKERDSI